MIRRDSQYLQGGMPSVAMLESVLREHEQQRPRLDKLAAYYRAEDGILSRTRAEGLPNNRIAHPFARYITAVATGYLIGNPVGYAVDDADDSALAPILEAFAACNVSAVDAENARNASIYGRGVEYAYAGEDGKPRLSALDPRCAFVVYDDTHEANPLFGVYYIPATGETGRQIGHHVWVMGADAIDYYERVNLGAKIFSEPVRQPHYFGGVPLTEYWNDEDERGDFEWIIPLIDAYDKLESDRLNDWEQMVDRLLVLKGCTMEYDDKGRPPWRQLREDKALALPDSEASAEYLNSSIDSVGPESLRAALIEDIHKMSMVPNLADANFAQNASGVAMRYKLWGLEQITAVKQQWFIEGLRGRLKLFANFMALRGHSALDVQAVRIEMTRALPANMLELAQVAQIAETAGAASAETRVRMLHAADNWTEQQVQEEVRRIGLERGTITDEDVALGDFERPAPTPESPPQDGETA